MRVLTLLSLAGCGGLSSEREAELAAAGLDVAIDRGIALGLEAFNAATSANIPDRTGDGNVSGTLTVGGQVDQGASDNKELRLTLLLDDYSDFVDVDDDDDRDVAITYDSDDPLPRLDLSLRDMPDGTLSGTLTGTFLLHGDVRGEVTLDLDLDGAIEEIPSTAGEIRKVDGSVTVTGNATNDHGGTWDVDITL